MMGIQGKKYKLLWFGKGDRIGGVGDMAKELCKMEKVRMVRHSVMQVVLILEENVLWQICGHALQSGRSLEEK